MFYKALTCYECASVDLPGNCRNRITCNRNEVGYVFLQYYKLEIID